MPKNSEYIIDAEVLKSFNTNILYNLTVIILPVSLFFNTLTILVFLRKQFKNSTNGFQNITLNIVNNLVLIFIFVIYYTKSKGNDIRSHSTFVCQSLSFIVRALVQLSSWIYVITVSERLIWISYPLEYRRFKYKKEALTLAVLLAFFFLCGLNSPNFWLKLVVTQTNSSANQTLNGMVCTGDAQVIEIRDTVVILFRMILPFILTLLLNIVLIVKLIRVKKMLTNRDTFMLRECKFALTLIVLNVLFILTLIPTIIALIYSNMMTNIPEMVNFVRHLSQLISSYNYCFNFFINLITNAMFRREFIKIFNLNKLLFIPFRISLI